MVYNEGTPFAFADGAVRLITYSAGLPVWSNLNGAADVSANDVQDEIDLNGRAMSRER